MKNGASYDEPIEKPLQWAADNLYDSHGVDIDEATIRTQMLYNVDDRGPHLLVWSRNRMGMAGGVYLAFRHDGTAWRYMGSFGAGPYKVLTSAKDGSLRIATYWRGPPGAGVLAVLTHNGATFVPVSSMFIQGDDDGLEEPGEARFNEVFGDFWFREGVVHKVFRDPPPSMEPVEAVEDWFSAHFGPHMREWQVQSVDVDTDGDGVAERLAFVGDSVNSYGDVVPVFRREGGRFSYAGCFRAALWKLVEAEDGTTQILSVTYHNPDFIVSRYVQGRTSIALVEASGMIPDEEIDKVATAFWPNAYFGAEPRGIRDASHLSVLLGIHTRRASASQPEQ